MRVELRGPDGIRQRMAEIQNQMDQVFGKPFEAALETATNKLGGTTGNLSGAIGKGLAPMKVDGGISLTPAGEAGELKALVRNAATENGVDPDLYQALISIESGFRTNAVSEKGAKGLAQLMDGTAKGLGVTDPFDPKQNANAGARLLSGLINKYNGNTELALAAYNAGSGRVREYGGVPPFASKYVQNVLALAERLRAR